MDFNEIKDKVLATLGQATEGARDLAGKAGDSARGIAGKATGVAKSGGRIAKLSMEAATAREDVKKTYLEIGKLYYDTHKDDPEGFFVQLFEEVRVSEELIAAKETEIAELKESLRSDSNGDISVDFEEVVDQAEAEAGSVRETVEEKAEAAGEKAEELKESVEDKIEAAGEKAEEVREAAREKLEAAEEKAEELKEAVREKAEELREKFED